MHIGVFKCKHLQTNVSISRPLEAVDRSSETQLQVDKNCNRITYEVKGLINKTVQFSLMSQKR